MKSDKIILSRINREYSWFVLVREVLLTLGIYLFHISFPTAFESIEYPFYLMMALIISSILIFLPVFFIISRMKRDFDRNRTSILRLDERYFFINSLLMAVLVPALGTQFINIFWFVTCINACIIFTSPFSSGRKMLAVYFSPVISLTVHYIIYLPHGKPFQPMEGAFAILISGLLYYTNSSICRKKTYDKIIEKGSSAIDEFCDSFGLTEREKEILSIIFEGKSTKQIGQELYISPGTVRNHISNIFQKTDTHSRMELVSAFNKN